MVLIERFVEMGDSPRNGSPGNTSPRNEQQKFGDIQRPIIYTETRVVPVCQSVLRKNRVIANGNSGAATAAHKVLRTQILQRMMANGWNTLAITSPGPAQGKTLTAVNLALSLAKENQYTVLLVDLDLRNPSVHRYFNYLPEHGLDDHLLFNTPIGQVLINPGIERFVMLPVRESIGHSSELLGSERMLRLVRELKRRYKSRFVIFDLPTLLQTDDVLAFLPLVEAALLVIEPGKTSRQALIRAAGLLEGTHLLGTVLNKVREPGTPFY
jgi:protein-tyrosine kinase